MVAKIPDNGLNITDLAAADDFSLSSDSAVINFGADGEIKLTHVADTGLALKHTATADDKPIVLTLQTGEIDMAANDVIGKIAFQAPDEGTGTDAILVSAAIQAVAEGDHSSSSNATRLEFMTGASEAAATKMKLLSTGELQVEGGFDCEGSIIFNNDSADVDFRVESNGKTHMLFVDGGNDAICVGTDTHDTGPLVVQTGNTHATAMTIQSTGHTQLMLKDTDASSNDKYWGLQVSGGDFNILTCDDDKNGGFLTPITIDSTGAVTKPLQPAFGAYTTQQTNMAVDSYVDIQFDNEIFDKNADFNTTNYTFTAPVTGTYQLNAIVQLQQVPTDATAYFGIRITTSNRAYVTTWDAAVWDANSNYLHLVVACMADMDASDTAVVKYYQAAGTQQVDSLSGGRFNGALIC